MLLGLSLFWVGAVLFLNGCGYKVGDREIAVIDVFVGTLTLAVAIYLAFGPGANADSIKRGVSAVVYLHLLLGRVEPLERRRRAGAWLVLLVCRDHLRPDSSAELCYVAYDVGLSAGVFLSLLGCPLVSFLFTTCGGQERTHKVGTLCTLEGIYTGWIPGYLLLTGATPGGPVPPY